MDENLKPSKEDVSALKVEVINQKVEEKKDENNIEAPEYFEIKIAKEDIDDIEVE